MTEDRVDWHLWNWARSHVLSREAGEDFPSHCSVIENYTSGMDFDRAYDNMCKGLAEATDTVIDDLETLYGAVYKRAIYAQLLGGAWELPDIALGIHYRAAVPLVGRGLDRRGIL